MQVKYFRFKMPWKCQSKSNELQRSHLKIWILVIILSVQKSLSQIWPLKPFFSNLRLILWRILRHSRGFVFSSVRVWGLQEMQPKVMQQKIRERLCKKVRVKTLDCSIIKLDNRFNFILDWTLKFIRKVCHNFSWCLTAPTLKSVELCSPSEEKKL